MENFFATVMIGILRLRGTEGRPADRPIAPREEVFEYIVFRVNEIKDLTPCEYMLSALHHDVAMVQRRRAATPRRARRPDPPAVPRAATRATRGTTPGPQRSGTVPSCSLRTEELRVIQVNSSVFRPKPGSASDKIDRVTLCGQRGALQNTSMMRVRDTKIFLVSAYHDQREAGQSTRIIGIANRYEPDVLSCHFCCRGHSEILTVTASAYVHSDHFDFPYGTADFLCTEPLDCEPGHVSVQRMRTIPDEEEAEWVFMPVRNRLYMPPTFTQEFSVCISTLFGNYGNVLQFVQAIEMYRILGAGRVTVYNTSCSSELNKVLLYYIKTGLVEVVQWPITDYVRVSRGWHYPEHPGELHYYGQIAALNDCVSRHMYSTRYLVLTDIDEVIIPLKHTKWKDLMRYLNDKYGADIYTFENHVFPYTVSEEFRSKFQAWNAIPGVNIMRHIRREPNLPEVFNPTKMILNPRAVLQTSVHSTLNALGISQTVPGDIAIMHHYRSPKQPDLPLVSLVVDLTLWRYNATLIRNVNKVLNRVFWNE
ncbi:beta-1,4-galactosyltransferase galt-1-like [Petromyzon marinus]|uniref:beta-1,4-galactosyltransferase galt-1-like n=1 Tax=Petromyzon marinus TaxID=7757 RepID=UPI003F72954D